MNHCRVLYVCIELIVRYMFLRKFLLSDVCTKLFWELSKVQCQYVPVGIAFAVCIAGDLTFAL